MPSSRTSNTMVSPRRVLRGIVTALQGAADSGCSSGTAGELQAAAQIVAEADPDRWLHAGPLDNWAEADLIAASLGARLRDVDDPELARYVSAARALMIRLGAQLPRDCAPCTA
ncbi:hypothetical protein [Gordonia sp. N1V]|uniref:hypothetical protein n=1 Tax=Gordonia sp. N1V TaxID=3034163 RepID=UPI0023E1EE8F|nr:hypothetical protein [Gordonia sp. N1V]MDF3284992.1 hypothetical protein [Gordonia sp. N1V]